MDPSNAFLLAHRANALWMLKRPAESRKYWDQLLTRFPNFTIEAYGWHWSQGLREDMRAHPFTVGLKRGQLNG